MGDLADGGDSAVLLYTLRRLRPPQVSLLSPAHVIVQPTASRAVPAVREYAQ